MQSPPTQQQQQRSVIIHVFDEYRKTSSDFTCPRGVLLESMKYFTAFLNESNEHDEIDISVHCDVEIFEFLVEYMLHRRDRDWELRLSLDNIASILLSSEFLQMAELVNECTSYLASRLQEFVQLRVDVSCLSETSITKIADKCTAEQLQQLHDPKDRILSKLQRKKVDCFVKSLVRDKAQRLELCVWCDTLFMKQRTQRSSCRKSKQSIGVRGELFSQHQARPGWQLEVFLRELASDKAVTWVGIYWYIWAAVNSFDCASCRRECTFLEWHKCLYHPGSIVGQGPEAKYSCCSSRIFNADEAATAGCKQREHTPVRNEQYMAHEAQCHTFTSVWDQVRACQQTVCARSGGNTDAASSLPASIDTATVFSDIPTPDMPAAADLPAKKSSLAVLPPLQQGESSSAACRRQWRVLQLQEQDRTRMQQLARRLMLARKSATA